jgi:hypothetical protein
MSDPTTEGLSSVPPTNPNTENPNSENPTTETPSTEDPTSDPTTETEDPDGTPKENPAG